MEEGEKERLFYAIDGGDSHGVVRVLEEGLAVDTMFDGVHCNSAWSALHLCCEKGRIECAKVLLDAGANVNIRDKWNQPPLMYAVTSERVDMVNFLLHYGADPNARDGHGQTALHLSINCESDTCVSALGVAGAWLEARDVLGRTALWKAASTDGHHSHMEKLISLGANVDALDAKDKFTPIQAALWYGRADRMPYVERLLAAGARVTPGVGDPQHTALMTLVQRDWTLGADLTAEETQLARVLVTHAQCGGELDVVAPDGLYGGRRTLRHPRSGTALIMAAHRGAPSIVRLLLEAGADSNIQDVDGRTALHMAALFNHLQCVQLLLSANCRLDLTANMYINTICTAKENITAFECALHQCHTQVVWLMVDAGYDLRYEYYLRTNSDVPVSLLENPELRQSLFEAVGKPRDLMSLCRRTIRNRLVCIPRLVTDVLPLPPRLQSYVSLTGEFSIFT